MAKRKPDATTTTPGPNAVDAVYVRVSTGEQSIASQLPELDAWADSRRAAGHTVAIYKDTCSGRTMRRPGWDKLMVEVRAGQVATVCVWRLDRLGRTAGGVITLCEELMERDVSLISLKDGFDLSTATGLLLFNMLASIAQFETQVRGERVKAGMAAAKAAGKTWGGSKKGERVQTTARQRRMIVEANTAGTPIAAIARLAETSRATVYRVLEAAARG